MKALKEWLLAALTVFVFLGAIYVFWILALFIAIIVFIYVLRILFGLESQENEQNTE